ncbi:protein of unknown function [Clostridium beijerinckii]|nr:protein of unknown function [Clostridium beijerinckii]
MIFLHEYDNISIYKISVFIKNITIGSDEKFSISGHFENLELVVQPTN